MKGQRKRKKSVTHQQLLEKELELDRIAIDTKHWRKPTGFLSELEHAVRPEIHEGRLPHYGVIFADVDPSVIGWSWLKMPEKDLILGRQLADGIRSFTVFVDGKFVGVLSSDRGGVDEASLVGLIQTTFRSGAVITADASGIVRIVYPGGVAIHRHRRWREKPMVDTVISRTYDFVPFSLIPKLKEILSFAYHSLSPRHIGATLVWCLEAPTAEESAAMQSALDLLSLNLQIGEDAHRSILRHLLAQTDGATIIDAAGKLVGTGAHLKVSAESMKYITALKGTRHTSAQRFSFDSAPTILIVVSADGPVTLFSDGVNVVELKFVSADAEAKALGKMVPMKRSDIVPSSWEETCKVCGKTSIIEEVMIYGWKDREAARCPICRAELASSMCFTISAHVVKRLRTYDRSLVGSMMYPIATPNTETAQNKVTA
jgi:DNA integrity scanning protein DisA with diadenylate cyclase activity